jgi:ketosteroid isomerase-like protein
VTDEEQIAMLYEAYNTAFDQGHVDDYVALFTPDGSIRLPDGHTLVGADRIRRLAQKTADASRRPHHFVRNLQIQIDGRQASGIAHVVAVAVTGTDVELLVAGVYQDKFAHTPDGWKFTSRSVFELGPDLLPHEPA